MGQTAKSCREILFFGPVQNVLVVCKKYWTSPIFFGPVQKYFRHIEGSGIGAETI